MSSVNKDTFDEIVLLNSFSMDALTASRGVSLEEEEAYPDALDMAFEAYEQSNKAKRIAMAKKALALSPYAIDATLLLIDEDIKKIDDKIAACHDAVEKGKKFVGEDSLEDFHGELWMNMDARPLMRCMERLANLYAEKGDVDKADTVYATLLSMNQNDNQGIRYLYFPFLIENNLMGQAKDLYKRYKDDWLAMWQYLGALTQYTKGKPNKRAENMVKKAHASNPHFYPYLIGDKVIKDNGWYPDYLSPGDEGEAIYYAEDVIKPYQSIDGAVDWLKSIDIEGK